MKLLLGNNQDLLKDIDADSLDACVTDPPYGLEFMNKGWDYGVPTSRFWVQVFRVLKPGAHLISFGGTRTYHRMACAIEDAGFEIRDQIQWIYGSGFPKSHNIGKKIKAYPGYGSAIKPANEPIVLARKPLSEKTLEMNMLKWGVGGLNIDDCRVGTDNISTHGIGDKYSRLKGGKSNGVGKYREHQGRFPSNVILTHSASCVLRGEKKVKGSAPKDSDNRKTYKNKVYSGGLGTHDPSNSYAAEIVEDWQCDPSCPVAELDRQSGVSKIPLGNVTGTKAIGGIMNNGRGRTVSNTGQGDSGGASRFFYVAKASKSERDAGIETRERTAAERTDRKEGSVGINAYAGARGPARNHHPTVKPVKLMRYLVRLVSPVGSTVLDPFMGSGTTGIACVMEGFDFLGMEQNAEFIEIAKQRIDHATP